MKRDLVFVAGRLANLLDENRLSVMAKLHGIKKAKNSDSVEKLFAAYLSRADEGVLGRILVECAILLAASRGNASFILRDAAAAYKVDTDAIALKVKKEFTTKDKTKKAREPESRSRGKQPAKPEKVA